jgi:hypothetical protein
MVSTEASPRWSSAAGPGPEVAAVLRPHLGDVADEVIAAVVAEVPPFKEWQEGSRNLRQGVERGLAGFLELLVSGDEGLLPSREVYFDFGRGELRAGRSIDAVLTAYRIAAQASWRAMARAGHAAGLDPQALYGVAEATFAYMHRMSAATVEGFAYERSVRAGERRDRRMRLVELLLRTPPYARADLERDAAEVGWRVPALLAVLAFPDERVTRMAARLAPDALVARVGTMGYAVIPDPGAPGRRAAIEHGLREVHGALGPALPPADAAESARLARLALELPGAGRGLVIVDERRVELLLARDPVLAARIAEGALGPLDALPDGQRARLGETLESWLRHQGEVRLVAGDLHVHAQTVRYRVGRLRDLLGDRMCSSDGRLELELALRARRLADAPRAG